MDSFSSVPPHIQPPMAQVPSAIRELTRFVPSILMYSSMVVALLVVYFDIVCAPFGRPAPEGIEPALRETQHIDFKLFLLTQRAIVRHQRVNLILAERVFERGHSALAIGNDLSELRIGQLLDYR